MISWKEYCGDPEIKAFFESPIAVINDFLLFVIGDDEGMRESKNGEEMFVVEEEEEEEEDISGVRAFASAERVGLEVDFLVVSILRILEIGMYPVSKPETDHLTLTKLFASSKSMIIAVSSAELVDEEALHQTLSPSLNMIEKRKVGYMVCIYIQACCIMPLDRLSVFVRS